jgi:hypothetical protein
MPSKKDIDKAVTQLQKEMSSPEFKKALDKTNKMVEVTTPPKTKRYVYLVTNADPHAEDIILGIFSNVTKAQECAVAVASAEAPYQHRPGTGWTAEWYDEDHNISGPKAEGFSGKFPVRAEFMHGRGGDLICVIQREEVL